MSVSTEDLVSALKNAQSANKKVMALTKRLATIQAEIEELRVKINLTHKKA